MSLANLPRENGIAYDHPTPTSPMSLSINPQQLMLAAIERGSSLEFLERLLEIRSKLQEEEAKRQFHEAMACFQSSCPVIVKDKIVKDKNGRERYRYADLGSIVRQTGHLIASNGFSYTVANEQEGNSVKATVTVAHLGGHSQSSEFKVPTDKESFMSEPQRWASAATFAKRIAFSNAFGILTGDEDDDNDIEHPARKDERPPVVNHHQVEPQNAQQLDSLMGKIGELSRTVFATKAERDEWLKAGGYKLTTVGGCESVIRDLQSLQARPATPTPPAPAPASATDEKDASRRKYFATLRGVGLTEDEGKFACRVQKLLAQNEDGDYSIFASTATQIGAAIAWLETCDPDQVKLDYAAELAAQEEMGF